MTRSDDPSQTPDADGAGDPDGLTELLYDRLRALAQERLTLAKNEHSLQATALVHEVWLRMASAGETLRFRGEGHFQAVAAQAMRWILVDSARKRLAQRRGGGLVEPLPTDGSGGMDPAAVTPMEELLALDEALRALAAEHPRKADVVELRHFGGLGVSETAEALGISPATVKREWSFARAWLGSRLGGARDIR